MANIELPKDAEGREIPLDTKVLYNDRGVGYEVNRFTFGVDVITHEVEWTACSYGTGNMVYHLPVNSMHLERPDSWEKLEEDMDRCIEESDSCMYFSPGGDCFKCAKPDSETCGCTAAVFNDIKRRIRRLRGEN